MIKNDDKFFRLVNKLISLLISCTLYGISEVSWWALQVCGENGSPISLRGGYKSINFLVKISCLYRNQLPVSSSNRHSIDTKLRASSIVLTVVAQLLDVLNILQVGYHWYLYCKCSALDIIYRPITMPYGVRWHRCPC